MKKSNCEICGEYSSKRKICAECKKNYPYKSAGPRGIPFNRKYEYLKNKNG